MSLVFKFESKQRYRKISFTFALIYARRTQPSEFCLGKWNKKQSDETASNYWDQPSRNRPECFKFILSLTWWSFPISWMLIAGLSVQTIKKPRSHNTHVLLYKECIFGNVQAINFPFYMKHQFYISNRTSGLSHARWQILKKYYPTTEDGLISSHLISILHNKCYEFSIFF